MKLINYFGQEFEREKPLTEKDLEMKKTTMEIYMAMNNKNSIDEMLKTLTVEEAKLIGKSASTNYILDRMTYGF